MNRSQDAQPRIAERWNHFWFTAQPAYPLGLVRMAFAVVVALWTLVSLPDLYDLFGDDGVVPAHAAGDYRWSLFQVWSSDQALLVGWALLLIAALALAVGWHSRVAAALVFVLLLSFVRRDLLVFNSGDGVLTVLSLFLLMAPCGAALSLDQRRRTGSFWSAQDRSVWPVRLIQVQTSLIYLVAAQAKLAGATWLDGSAVSYAWRADQNWAVLPMPQWVWNDVYLVNVATWGTLVIELSIAILVWNRRWRVWALAAGVVLHLFIMVTLSVGFFSLAMFVLYLAFVPWETVERMPANVGAYWARVRRRRDRPDAPKG